MPLPFGSMS